MRWLVLSPKSTVIWASELRFSTPRRCTTACSRRPWSGNFGRQRQRGPCAWLMMAFGTANVAMYVSPSARICASERPPSRPYRRSQQRAARNFVRRRNGLVLGNDLRHGCFPWGRPSHKQTCIQKLDGRCACPSPSSRSHHRLSHRAPRVEADHG